MDNMFLQIFSILLGITGIIWILDKILYYNRKHEIFSRNIEIQKKNYHSTFTNTLYKSSCCIKYLGSIFPALLIVFIIRCFLYEPFYVHSNSMLPNLITGDYIIVKKFFYGISNPFTNNKIIIYRHPTRGEVIVFKSLKDYNTNYIKRIIGIPGDKITYDSINDSITIYENYKKAQHHNKKIYINYSIIRKKNNIIVDTNNFIQKIKNILQLNDNEKIIHFHCITYQEMLNNYKYHILISQLNKNIITLYFHQKKQPMQTWIIPENTYFVIGDNRTSSLDSRYFGFVSENDIIGKADYIWIHVKTQDNQWPIGIDISRIGKIY